MKTPAKKSGVCHYSEPPNGGFFVCMSPIFSFYFHFIAIPDDTRHVMYITNAFCLLQPPQLLPMPGAIDQQQAP
jgi:hypothetical protein